LVDQHKAQHAYPKPGGGKADVGVLQHLQPFHHGFELMQLDVGVTRGRQVQSAQWGKRQEAGVAEKLLGQAGFLNVAENLTGHTVLKQRTDAHDAAIGNTAGKLCGHLK